MNCTFVRNNLSAYMDGELDDRSSVIIRHHFDKCDSCSFELDSFKELGEYARSQVEAPSRLPAWESIARRLDDDVSTSLSTTPTFIFSWKTISGAVVALAASMLIIASFRVAQTGDQAVVAQASVAINLQPVLELFQQDAGRALSMLTKELSSEDVSIEQAEASFGRPTYVSTNANKNALPGNAKLASTKLLSFPFCKCCEGQCPFGPSGCNCVVCICERPDRSTFLVLEHCKSQKVSFGDLPVQLVSRDGRQLQQVTVDGVDTISWERDAARLTVIGLRSEAEVETLLASY
ncbi:zf-HC2 domain-containing protein [Novipirellula rosea]|uniref:Putative zinc-finger domain-containing protein n=1 Tax=Novipirellula rosea TaxID=1031540 RepID=A0ABP8NMS0_9BACT